MRLGPKAASPPSGATLCPVLLPFLRVGWADLTRELPSSPPL